MMDLHPPGIARNIQLCYLNLEEAANRNQMLPQSFPYPVRDLDFCRGVFLLVSSRTCFLNPVIQTWVTSKAPAVSSHHGHAPSLAVPYYGPGAFAQQRGSCPLDLVFGGTFLFLLYVYVYVYVYIYIFLPFSVPDPPTPNTSPINIHRPKDP